MQVPGWMVQVPAGLLAVIAIFADKGDKLMAFVALFTAWTANLPMGYWSFVLSLGAAVVVWAAVMRSVKRAKDGSRPHKSAIVCSLLFAIVFNMLQQYTVKGVGDGVLLMAAASGFIAGLMAPFIGELLRGLWLSRTKP